MSKNINIIHELEKVLYHPTYMGQSDKCGVNLAVNAIINRIDELGWDITEKPYHERVQVGDVIKCGSEHFIVREVYGAQGAVQECSETGQTCGACCVINNFYWNINDYQAEFICKKEEDQ